ncbi:SDR family oxidoreductase [Mesorhizobium amorphae]|uniref:SDR family oxidoreductase n=1 Tax=Mesorhizobium amorphae TaxID=71433 RepID=UPI003ECF4F27
MNQRVMITAGGSGIGLAIAKTFADSGAKVHICDVDERALQNAAQTYPQIVARKVDLANEKAVDDWFDDALGDLGGLDVLINNAGTKGPTGYVEEVKLQDWRDCLGICLDAQFLCARRATPVMKRQASGSIVNISSTAGLYGYGLRTPYAAAKWAVIGFTKSLAVELGPFNVRANAICPGSVNGARMQQVIKAEADSRGVAIELVQEEYVQSQSIKRFVEPEEIAEMCLFLASPAAKMVTGQALAVDGHTETFHIGS